jgi:hypothetical protein
MNHKLLLRKLTISSPTMKVKRELLLPVKIALWVVPLALCGALTLGAYELGLRFSNADSGVQAQLSEQIKTLEAENARLKENLSYFNSLLPTNTATGTSDIVIQKLALETVAPSKLRFRALVVKNGSDKLRFNGNLQLVVTALQDNQLIELVFPNDQSTDHDKYKVGFMQYQQVEWVLALPEGVTVKNVQARVMENGQVRAQRATGEFSKTDLYSQKLSRSAAI